MNIRKLGMPVVAMVALAGFGCASAPDRNASLERARAAYSTAAADAIVGKEGGIELKAAADALQRADTAWRDKEDEALVDHLAYLAQQRVEIARAAAQGRAANREVESSAAERDRVQLMARTREAEEARQQAQRQTSAADRARRQAQMQMVESAQARMAAAQSQSRVQDLQSRLADFQAKRSERGLVLTLGDLVFDTGSSTISPGGARRIDQLANALREHREATVKIEGFTDSIGSESLNQRLSEQRADAVRQALVNRGVDASRISAAGYGEASPVASNDTTAGRQLNRRVEVVISTNDAPQARR